MLPISPKPRLATLRQLLLTALLAVLAAVLLAGCSASPSALPTPDSTGELTTAPSAPAVETSVSTAPTPSPDSERSPAAAPEQPVTLLPLEGPITGARAEVSSMAWFGDTLILAPQYPSRFRTDGNDGVVFGLAKEDILAAITAVEQGEPVSLLPIEIPIRDNGLFSQVAGFEGFEALAIRENRVYVTIESRPGAEMLGYLTTGEIASDLSVLSLSAVLEPIPPQTHISNLTDEALLLAGDQILTFYEINGQEVNPDAVAHLFSLDMQPLGVVPLPNLEYRLTDVTPLDETGRFYAINYFFPGDTHLAVDEDPLRRRYGSGVSQQNNHAVERLVAFEWTGSEVRLVDEPPILLQLDPGGEARNWEGIARLDDRGFLLVTDTYPSTLLGFVPFPE